MRRNIFRIKLICVFAVLLASLIFVVHFYLAGLGRSTKVLPVKEGLKPFNDELNVAESYSIFSFLTALGEDACLMKEYEVALDYFSSVLANQKEVPRKGDLFRAYLGMGKSYLGLKDFKMAWKNLKEAEKINLNPELCRLLLRCSKALKLKDEVKKYSEKMNEFKIKGKN